MTDPTNARSLGHHGWVTSVITEQVLRKDEEAFEDWAARANAQLATAEGFVGIDTMRIEEGEVDRYITLIHFASYEQLDAEIGSPAHQELLSELQPLVADTQLQRAEGMEVWYSLPAANRRQNPSYWRQVVLITPIVFGLILVTGFLMSPLEGRLPMIVTLAISVAILSMLLTWPVMPWITRIFRGFLYPAHN